MCEGEFDWKVKNDVFQYFLCDFYIFEIIGSIAPKKIQWGKEICTTDIVIVVIKVSQKESHTDMEGWVNDKMFT